MTAYFEERPWRLELHGDRMEALEQLKGQEKVPPWRSQHAPAYGYGARCGHGKGERSLRSDGKGPAMWSRGHSPATMVGHTGGERAVRGWPAAELTWGGSGGGARAGRRRR